MTAKFRFPALVCNSASGSFDEAQLDALAAQCAEAGAPLRRIFRLPDDQLPEAAELAAAAIDLLLVWTGDGTINAAAAATRAWDGPLLALPGGTLNLFAKSLHGDRPAAAIVADALAGVGRAQRPPIIRCAAGDAYITVVAGPATRWAEVREVMRRDGLLDAGQAAPEAMDTTLNAPGVRTGDSDTYQAIILTPTADGLCADGIRTEGVLDVLQHGLAWLRGDFRDGPSDHLVTAPSLDLTSDQPISLELDGELAELGPTVRFVGDTSPVAFWATAPLGSDTGAA